MKMIQVVKTINPTTGEVIGENKQIVYRTDRLKPNGWRFKESLRFRSFEVEGLPWADRGRLAAIATRVDKNNRLPAVPILAKSWDLSERGTYHLLNRLLGVGAIGTIQIKNVVGYPMNAYYLNPAIAFAGIVVTPALWRLFRSSMLPFVPKVGQRHLDQACEGLADNVLPGEEKG